MGQLIWPYLSRRIARRNPPKLKLRPSVGRYVTVYDVAVADAPLTEQQRQTLAQEQVEHQFSNLDSRPY